MKIIEFNDGTRYKAEDCIDGCLINPVLPKDFDNKDLAERSPKHMKLWEGMPFIMAISFEKSQAFASYNKYYEHIKQCDAAFKTNSKIESREEWEAERKKRKDKWSEHYPTGRRYEVKCLDGGSWDRSTWWGWFNNIEDALACARSGKPSWG